MKWSNVNAQFHFLFPRLRNYFIGQLLWFCALVGTVQKEFCLLITQESRLRVYDFSWEKCKKKLINKILNHFNYNYIFSYSAVDLYDQSHVNNHFNNHLPFAFFSLTVWFSSGSLPLKKDAAINFLFKTIVWMLHIFWIWAFAKHFTEHCRIARRVTIF